MSEIKNGEGYPVQGTPHSTPTVEPKIWRSQYPSLVCTQCQERSLIQPVLPSAPYPVTPVLEHIPYPRLPMPQVIPEYHYVHQPNEISNGEELVNISNTKKPTVSAVYSPEVTFVTEESKAVQTTAVLSETEDKRDKRTGKYCSRICWIIGAFITLILIGAVVALFYTIYNILSAFGTPRRMASQIDQEWAYGHTLRD